MGVFILVLGGAYFLYKYIEEEKGMGKKGGLIAVGTAAAVLIMLTLSYQAGNTFDSSEIDTVVEIAFSRALLFSAVVAVVGGIAGLDQKDWIRELPKSILATFLFTFVIHLILGFIFDWFFAVTR